MEPSFPISKSKYQVERTISKEIIDCPNGTVPILRNTKEYVTNGQHFVGKHFNPFTVESHGTHFAGVRLQGHRPFHGMASWISVHDLNISQDQASYAHLYVGSRVNNKDNFIPTGWMINPNLFGDRRPWGYAFWKGANGTGCYNTMCSGFIQVSKTDPLTGPFPEAPEGKRNIGSSIQKDKIHGNWWITDIRYKKDDEPVGYWPKELFDLIPNGVNMVGVGGAVESSPSSGISPPMGNGHLPAKDDKDDMVSARVQDILVLDSSKKFRGIDYSKLEIMLDSEKCYGLRRGKKHLFTFGGPGGNSCGI
ncbi:hypothetical protein CARUB_v10003582mg [Capsella rubella]|uniref:Neprosin PEP catalytic domain-containing protein n=2 Tax=Capsella rubella TaxID=81985 RepID=R0FK61_9BRAS|nr:hypothetical protein CARUB_v10003582mg [Capsella rubella]